MKRECTIEYKISSQKSLRSRTLCNTVIHDQIADSTCNRKFLFHRMIYTLVYQLMQHVAEQAMQQMFGETNLLEIRRNSLSTCRIICLMNE